MLNASDDIKRRVEAWRKHPNYGKTCECGHVSVMHFDGEGECAICRVGCRHFVAEEVAA